MAWPLLQEEIGTNEGSFCYELILTFLLLFLLMETRRNWPPGMFYLCLTKPSVNGINTHPQSPFLVSPQGGRFCSHPDFRGTSLSLLKRQENYCGHQVWYEKHHCGSSKWSQSLLGLCAKPIEMFSGFGLGVTVKQQNSVPACFFPL